MVWVWANKFCYAVSLNKMFLLKGVAINSLELHARHKDENWWCGNQSGAALLRLAPPKRRKKMLLFLASGKFHQYKTSTNPTSCWLSLRCRCLTDILHMTVAYWDSVLGWENPFSKANLSSTDMHIQNMRYAISICVHTVYKFDLLHSDCHTNLGRT